MSQLPGRSEYFSRLRRQNKWLLGIVILYITANAAGSIFGHQTSPAYIWAMYAVPLDTANVYEVLTIEADNKPITSAHSFQDYSQLMTRYPPSYFAALKDGSIVNPGYNTLRRVFPLDYGLLEPDKEAIERFPHWLKVYLKENGTDAAMVSIRKELVSYDKNGHVRMLNSQTIQEQ